MVELETPIVKTGKLLTSGSSITVAMPKEWLKSKGLEAGQEIIIVANGDLRIMKKNKENTERLRNQLNKR